LPESSAVSHRALAAASVADVRLEPVVDEVGEQVERAQWRRDAVVTRDEKRLL